MTGLLIFLKRLFGIPLTARETIYSAKGPVLIAIPKPQPKEQKVIFDTSKGIPGIDVSHWQAEIDFNAVKDAGARFVYIKVTDGATGTDTAFGDHARACAEADLPWGGYHFFRFNDDPIKQAQHFCSTMHDFHWGDLPMSLDVEWDKNSVKYGEGKTMDAAAAAAVLQCLTEIERISGETPLLYTNYYFFNAGTTPQAFEKHDLWIPSYAAQFPGEVKIPAPWTRNKMKLWQFSEKISLGGATNVDGNYFLGSEEDLKMFGKVAK